MRSLLLTILLALASEGVVKACLDESPARKGGFIAQEQAAFDNAFRRAKTQADGIYLATVQQVTVGGLHATFRIDRVDKGGATKGSLVTFGLPDMDKIPIGCGSADDIALVVAHPGEVVILYVAGGRVLLSAPIHYIKSDSPPRSLRNLIV